MDTIGVIEMFETKELRMDKKFLPYQEDCLGLAMKFFERYVWLQGKNVNITDKRILNVVKLPQLIRFYVDDPIKDTYHIQKCVSRNMHFITEFIAFFDENVKYVPPSEYFTDSLIQPLVNNALNPTDDKKTDGNYDGEEEEIPD